MITAFSISLPFSELKARSGATSSIMLAEAGDPEPSEGSRQARMPELKLKTDCVLDEEAGMA